MDIHFPSVCVILTDGIFGKDRFGGFTGVSSSQFVLSHHPELVLAALHQVLDSVLSGWVQWLSGGSGPPLGCGLLLFQDIVGDRLATIARPVPQHQGIGGVHLSDRRHLRGLRDSCRGAAEQKLGYCCSFKDQFPMQKEYLYVYCPIILKKNLYFYLGKIDFIL